MFISTCASYADLRGWVPIAGTQPDVDLTNAQPASFSNTSLILSRKEITSD
ncbi:hypothetical protein N644_2159 [Lactiplantibacillus paraplantarum]|nr:hypothetical protein N644_2159 [Lactiplantibacillus paraplantarum]